MLLSLSPSFTDSLLLKEHLLLPEAAFLDLLNNGLDGESSRFPGKYMTGHHMVPSKQLNFPFSCTDVQGKISKLSA